MIARLVVTVVAALLAAAPSIAAAQSSASSDLIIGRVDDSEYPTVEVTVTVPAELGDMRLSKEAFSLAEDGKARQAYLGNSPADEESPPPSVVLAIDVSGSMGDSIEPAKQAADNFVASLPEGSQVGLVTFGKGANLVVPPTSNLRAVQSKIDDIEANADVTALYAGVQRAARSLPTSMGGSGNVVLLSDGDDTAGDVSSAEALGALANRGARLWAVALGDDIKLEALETLAGAEGHVVSAANATQLEEIYSGLASDLAREYVLRYDSQASGETELTVALDYGSLYSKRTRMVTIEGTPAPAAARPHVTAVDPETITVTVPLLGTTSALATGLTALAIGGFIILLVVLLPRHPRPGERLVFAAPTTVQGRTARLTSIAQWTTDIADRRLHRGGLGKRLDRQLEAAGVNLRSGELVVIVLSVSVVAFTVGAMTVSPLLGLVLAPVPFVLGGLWLSARSDRRRAAFAEQLIDMLQLVGSSLRAGYGLTQGIDAVARDAEEPAAGEFRRIILEHRLGRDLDEAMENCAARMDNDDFRWVVQAISIHRDVGGDLSKVLDNIITTIRDRAEVMRQVRTLSAEGRMSARVLTALPILVLVLMLFTSPDYMSVMLEEALGIALLAVGGLMILIGVLVVRRMANIQY